MQVPQANRWMDWSVFFYGKMGDELQSAKKVRELLCNFLVVFLLIEVDIQQNCINLKGCEMSSLGFGYQRKIQPFFKKLYFFPFSFDQ